MITLEKVTEEHKKHFGIDPVLLDTFNDPMLLAEEIIKAIQQNKPYDEYKDLPEEDKEAYDKGRLIF